MESNQTRCYRCVGDIRKMIKSGKTKSGSQRYICRVCEKTRVENYAYQAYKAKNKPEDYPINQRGIRYKKHCKNTRNISHNIIEKNCFYC